MAYNIGESHPLRQEKKRKRARHEILRFGRTVPAFRVKLLGIRVGHFLQRCKVKNKNTAYLSRRCLHPR